MALWTTVEGKRTMGDLFVQREDGNGQFGRIGKAVRVVQEGG